MRSQLRFLFVSLFLSFVAAIEEPVTSTNSYLLESDKLRFKKILENGFKLEDLPSVYYAVQGYKLLNEATPKASEICKYLVKASGDGTKLSSEDAFYLAATWKLLGSCGALKIQNDLIQKSLLPIVDKSTSSVQDLYYAVGALKALDHKIAKNSITTLTQTLQDALKKDESLLNLGYTFNIAADIASNTIAANVKFSSDRLESIVSQADEVNGIFLQFEGGLSVSSNIVTGILKLSTALNNKVPLTQQQIVKFANYFLSRRSVQTPKGIVGLLSSLEALAENKQHKPICITLNSNDNIVSAKQPLVTLKVCDILGKPLPVAPNVVAKTANKLGDNTALITNKAFQASSSDKTLFTLNFYESKPDRGFYKISVGIASLSVANSVTVKVLSEIAVDYLEIGTGDADQATQPKLTKVTFPEKLKTPVDADSQQKLVIRFLLKDVGTKKAIRVHQAFVRLSSATNEKSGQEIIFVAEPDSSNVYKFDMPVGGAASNFGYQSGGYNVELIVGDAVLSNPFQWTLATANLKFPTSDVARASASQTKEQHKILYLPKPEIKHLFREPEIRPPVFVSNLFTGLCLAPVLILLGLWMKLGINISNFPLSLSAVLFHLGLGAIFILFGIFWLKLNMFVTLRYLLGLGVVTFLAGNKLLTQIAHNRKISQHR